MSEKPVVLINAFEVPAGEEEAFVRSWQHARDFLRTQPGYISTRLHKSISSTADFRFVNVAQWESEQAFRAATTRPEAKSGPFPFRYHAALYEVAFTD